MSSTLSKSEVNELLKPFEPGQTNNPSGLEKNDTLEDALKRAGELASPNGSSYSGMILDRKDLRRIVLLVREYRNLLSVNPDPAMDKWIEELEEITTAAKKKVWEYNMSYFTASAKELEDAVVNPLEALIQRMKQYQK